MTLEDLFYNDQQNINNVNVGGTYVGSTMIGSYYKSAETGARVEILPDPYIGIVCYSSAGSEVFKTIVHGTDIGDVIMGNYSSGKYAMWDDSAATMKLGPSAYVDTRLASTLAGAINASGNLINDVINARLDSSAKQILDAFTFGTSGAIQIGTYVNGVSGDIRISPNGIVGRNSAGNNTFTINGTTGNATFAGDLSAATGTFSGTVTASALIVGTSASTIETGANRAYNALNASNNLITDLINARLDSSAKQILGDFTFGASGAIKMITDANNGLWLSPTGILGKKAGATTFAVDTSGNATFAGTLSAATGTLGTITTGLITLDTTGYIKGGQTAYNTGTGFFLGYSTDAYKFSIGNPNKDNLTYDGSVLRIDGLLQVGNHYILGNWNDGFTQTVTGSGAITRRLFNTGLIPGATANSVARLQSPRTEAISDGTARWNLTLKFFCLASPNFTTTDTIGFVGLVDGGATINNTNTTDTTRHIGFYFQKDPATSAIHIYATNADGTTQKITDIGSPSASVVSLRFDKSVYSGDVKFYKDNVLMATHTTNIPTTTSNDFAIEMVVNNNTNTSGLEFLGIGNDYQLVGSW